MTRKYTSKHNRQKDAFQFEFKQRDEDIIRAVNSHRYLTVSQIRRLFFPTATTNKNTQRRLKYLFHAGYLGRLTPDEEPGNGSSSCAYFLDKKGADFLRDNPRDENDRVWFLKKSGGVGHYKLAHALAVSEFRINVELAIKDHPIFMVRDVVMDFQIEQSLRHAIGSGQYQFFGDKKVPYTGESYRFIPDLQFVLQGREGYEHLQSLFFIEVDRGTEGLNVIKRKVVGYNIFHREQYHNRLGIGEFEKGFKVLLQTTSPKRAANIRQALQSVEGNQLVSITDYPAVKAAYTSEPPLNIFTANLWTNSKGEVRSIFKR